MSTVSDRNKRIAKLTQSRIAGFQAETRLREFEPVLKAREVAYIKELISKSRTEGDVYDAAVWKLVALNDLVLDLDRAVAAGKKADKQLHELREVEEFN